MKKMLIDFTPIEDISEEYYPVPAKKNIPQWYKNTNSYVYGNKFDVSLDGFNNETIKKCIPVFDAMTAGYIIKTHVDVMVKNNEEGAPYYLWPQYDPIDFHPFNQADKHPQSQKEYSYPKWISPWSIKTPKGYSCLFVPPMHNPNNIFSILPGIVDTDTYTNPVNFPFVLEDENFSGIIPAGTDICQVIPFKREQYKMKISLKQSEQIKKNIRFFQSKFLSNYRNNFWIRKSFD